MKFQDPIIQTLINKYPAPNFQDKSTQLFENLIESIISQQLSIKAADTIYKRFLALFNQRELTSAFFPTPQQVLDKDTEDLRSAGISYQKINYIKSTADAFLSDLIDTEKIKQMNDEEVIQALTQIKGVGKWTAEMTLIFTLNRPDVFSLGDLGIRNAIKKLYGITDQQEILKLAETWKPYRSTACWYLWRSLENG